LTITDFASRYLLTCDALSSTEEKHKDFGALALPLDPLGGTIGQQIALVETDGLTYREILLIDDQPAAAPVAHDRSKRFGRLTCLT
jgi:hypothetical protein